MPIRILIADDHSVFRSGLKALLRKERDLRVVAEAANGTETLKAAAAAPLDVVLLDLSMPGLPGARVAEELRQQHPGLAIVVLTMHENVTYLRELLRIGVSGFVLKRSRATDLLAAIRAAGRGEKYVDPSLAAALVTGRADDAPAPIRSPALEVLSPREQEVCGLLAYGHTNPEIAARLGISDRTVEAHRANLMAKLELKTRAQLVGFAIENGLLKTGQIP